MSVWIVIDICYGIDGNEVLLHVSSSKTLAEDWLAEYLKNNHVCTVDAKFFRVDKWKVDQL